MRGTVKLWKDEKGFGFIVGEDGIDYFVHVTQLPTGTISLMPRQRVSFEVSDTPKGPQATEIQLVVEQLVLRVIQSLMIRQDSNGLLPLMEPTVV